MPIKENMPIKDIDKITLFLVTSVVGIDQCGFCGADTNISTVHGPIANTDNQYF